MKFDIITLFPNLVEPYLGDSILARAIRNKKIKVAVHNARDWASDKHHTVDDSPYGGGPGMVLKIDVWFRALKAVVSKGKKLSTRVILLDPAGKQFSQTDAKRYA